MISRINKIKNIGRFEDFNTSIELGLLTLIYAENGQGKSTLADIVRSLRTGEQDRVTGRKTRGSENTPELELEMNHENLLVFRSNRWHTSFDNVYVFDDVFINENIYSGNAVQATPHRRNLASMIIGDTAVRFQKQEDALRESIADRKESISQLELEIDRHILSVTVNPMRRLSVKAFVNLPKTPAVDRQLESQNTLVRQLRERDAIRKKPVFTNLPVPQLPLQELERLLSVTLDNIQKGAETRVLNHLENYGVPHMEDWLNSGIEMYRSNAQICPFCGQQLKAGHLIAHYQSYFDEEYKQLKTNIAAFAGEHLNYEAQLAEINRALQKNSDLLEFWQGELPSIGLISPSYDDVSACLKNATRLVDEVITKKSNAPLELPELDQLTSDSIERWARKTLKLVEYNGAVNQLNREISNLKQKLETSNLEEEESKEQSLQYAKSRHDNPNVDDLCSQYIIETKAVKSENDLIKETRTKKDQAINQLFKTNKDNVNKYLGSDFFDVDFCICEFGFTRDSAGERVDAYAIKFPAGIIPVGPADAIPAESSFKNAMSAGDRSTLAFAIFLAHLENVEKIEEGVIVIDDPITSMDANRRWATYEAICEVCNKDCQVVLLSHDAEFLHIVWDEYGRPHARDKSTTRLWIRPREGATRSNVIEPGWDSEAFLMSRHRKRIQKVEEFINGVRHNPEEVGKCLRQIIEHHYKDLYPTQYTSKLSSFGAFLGCVRNSKAGDDLSKLKNSKLDELEKANRFLRGLHHDDNLSFPSDTELQRRSKKVLAHIRRD